MTGEPERGGAAGVGAPSGAGTRRAGAPEPEAPPPLGRRGALAVALLVALADVTIYRGRGFAGAALLVAVAPLLLLLGSVGPRLRGGMGVVGALLLLLAGRLLWCGSEGAVVFGAALLIGFAMTLAGLRPHVLETAVFAAQTVQAGYLGLARIGRSLRVPAPRISRDRWLATTLPIAALAGFGLLFVLANPDLLASLGKNAQRLLEGLRDWVVERAPRPGQVVFWFVVAWVALGLLRPLVGRAPFLPAAETRPEKPGETGLPGTVDWHPVFRNTLLGLIGLFAVYLAFEFGTLWFREFPAGFNYSGYAHQGAAWLTLALALATALLSVVFSGRTRADPRAPRLRRLAWVWSAENLLLALAVYNRLFIYVGFNGMTRMRVVGLFGTTAVVAGFALVLQKIARDRDLVWLVRHQLWALALTVYAYLVAPVDAIAVGYNARRILAGDPAPSVMIAVHLIDAEGLVRLLPLLECQDPAIREGVHALLAEAHTAAEARAARRAELGWTTYQVAEVRLLRGLREASPRWAGLDARARQAALQRFQAYARRWY